MKGGAMNMDTISTFIEFLRQFGTIFLLFVILLGIHFLCNYLAQEK